jgi:hypothetical protein
MTTSALHIALADALMLGFAIAAAVSISNEPRRRIIPRWRLLLPGVLAALSDAILIAYPEFRDLFQLELWTVNTAALLAGVARGAFLPMFSDHNLRLVLPRRTWDGILVALLLVAFAGLQTWIEVSAGAQNRQEAVMEFFMTLAAGYLFGRSIAAWIRAGVIQPDDLDRPL